MCIRDRDWGDLTASLQPISIEPVGEKSKPSPLPVAQPHAVTAANPQSASTNSVPPVSKPPAQSPEDTARSIPKKDWADLTASLQPKPVEPVAEKPKPSTAPVAQAPAVPTANAQPAPASVAQILPASAANAQRESANSALPASPDPALVEAVVQRVLDKMRPQVVEIITKEFLRPIVQALVHREVEKH